MFVIDTNVVSELMRPNPDSEVAVWFFKHDLKHMYLTAVNEAELLYGVAIMPEGKRRVAREILIDHWLTQGFTKKRILPFDSAAALAYAEVAASRRHAGRPIKETDGQIAAICKSYNAILVTRNVRDFEGTSVELINPWKAA